MYINMVQVLQGQRVHNEKQVSFHPAAQLSTFSPSNQPPLQISWVSFKR